MSFKSAHSLLSNDQIFDWAGSMVIWIAIKIKLLALFTTPSHSIKFYYIFNKFINSVADRQTDREKAKLALPKT